MNRDDGARLNPYAPQGSRSPAIDPYLLESSDRLRSHYATDELKLKICWVVYFLIGAAAAVPAVAGTVGGGLMLGSPELAAFKMQNLTILATGLVMTAVSIAYFWTSWGLYNLHPFATRLAVPLILPVLGFVPTGPLAVWMALRVLSSDAAFAITSPEYRAILKRSARPPVRIPVALLVSQWAVVVQAFGSFLYFVVRYG